MSALRDLLAKGQSKRTSTEADAPNYSTYMSREPSKGDATSREMPDYKRAAANKVATAAKSTPRKSKATAAPSKSSAPAPSSSNSVANILAARASGEFSPSAATDTKDQLGSMAMASGDPISMGIGAGLKVMSAAQRRKDEKANRRAQEENRRVSNVANLLSNLYSGYGQGGM